MLNSFVTDGAVLYLKARGTMLNKNNQVSIERFADLCYIYYLFSRAQLFFMKKKVVLKRIYHRDRWRIAIMFDYDAKLKEIIRSIRGSAFSGTNRCFYVDDSEENRCWRTQFATQLCNASS